MTSRQTHRAAGFAASAVLVACLFPGTVWAARSIEASLQEQVASQLASANIDAKVEMDGRNATITIQDAADAEQVIQVLDGVQGIAKTEVVMAPAPTPTMQPEVNTQPDVEVPQPSISDTPTVSATPTPTPDPLPSDITMLFDGGSASVRQDSELLANQLAQQLIDHPNWRVTLIGHTDNGLTEEERMALGLERAQAIASILQAQGVSAERISMESRGDHEPVGDWHTEEGLAKNRRVVAHVEEIA